MTADSWRRSPAAIVVGSVGVLGGTFDPIHIGHLAIAEEVREALGLERIRFVPTGSPVHRSEQPQASAADRAAMVELAIEGNPTFELSRVEVERPGPSFAVDTLEAFVTEAQIAGRTPDVTFILSAEAYASLPEWQQAERLFALCRMAVVPRPGARPADPTAMAAFIPGADTRTVALDGPRLGISGSTIRARVAAGRSIRYLVPDAVIGYITDHGLYIDTDRRTAQS